MGYHEHRGPGDRIYRTFVMETIAEHAEDHIHHAHCGTCQHSADVDMAYWIEKLGADYMMADFRKRFRCSACGSKNVRVIGSYCGKPK